MHIYFRTYRSTAGDVRPRGHLRTHGRAVIYGRTAGDRRPSARLLRPGGPAGLSPRRPRPLALGPNLGRGQEGQQQAALPRPKAKPAKAKPAIVAPRAMATGARRRPSRPDPPWPGVRLPARSVQWSPKPRRPWPRPGKSGRGPANWSKAATARERTPSNGAKTQPGRPSSRPSRRGHAARSRVSRKWGEGGCLECG